MSQNPFPTRIITVFSDGTIHVQELHQATTVMAFDDPNDPGSNNPTPPPKDP